MNIEINTDNNLLQNRTKSTNCDGLSVSKKIDLFERYLKENSNESIHSNTIFEGYNIGIILIQLRYLMKNNLIKYNSEELKRMENLGLLENTKETIYVKIKRLKQFCEKHPYAFSNIYRLRKDLNKKEKMEFEKVFKDYTYIRERKSRGKLPKKLEEELNNSQIGGVFKKEDIGELYEKYEIGDKEKKQIINEFGNMENLKKSYKKYMIKLANAKNYNEIHRIKIENKESAMENPKIPLVRNFYLGSQSLEKQKALLNFISYMYGEKYATNIILGPDVFEKDSEQLSDEDKQELLNMIDVENENIGVIDEDTIEEMAIENINFSTQLLYKAMKYNGINTVGDLLERARSKKDLLTMAYIGNKEAEEIIEKLSEFGITVYNGVKTREKIGLEIKSLNLSHRTYMLLARNEIYTVEQLVERIRSKDDLLQLRWIGEKTANEIIEKLAENGITIYKDENEEAIKIALSKLRIQQEKMQELDANILYLKKQREVGEQLKNQSKGEDDNGR